MRLSTQPLFLALDQGGHSSRALAFTVRGELVASAQVSVATTYPHPGWVEQDALALADSLRAACTQLYATLGSSRQRLVSAGLATQRSNCLCWDRHNGAPLSPGLSWQDRRAHAWLAAQVIDAGWLRARTGLLASPHYGASKLRWCLDHLPEVRAAAEDNRLTCGPLAAFLMRQLSGAAVDRIDPANAARTLLWNLAERDWDAGLLQCFGVARELLPENVASCFDFGLLDGVPLRILTGDQSAALYAGGMPRSDTLYINLGTGAFLQRLLADYAVPPDGLLGSIVYADATRSDYVLEATVNGAGTAFDWARDQLGIQAIEKRLPEWLRMAGDIPLFLNGIGGLGSPWWRPQFASRFVGQAETWAQAVAVAESMVFLIMSNLERLDGPQPVQRIRLSGGLAQLDGLCQRLADLAQRPVERTQLPEATARGLTWLLVQDHDRHQDAGVAGTWQAVALEHFEPADNPACAARYAAWDEAMRGALGTPG